MRKTPLEIANGDHRERLNWILDATDPRELHELFRHAAVQTHSGEYLVATNGIRILVAESQAASAAKLENQTATLIALTRSLKIYTIALFVLTGVLVGIEVFHFFQNRQSPVQLAPHTQQTNHAAEKTENNH
jgi:hypothetical protein